jgi:hypothetical protein
MDKSAISEWRQRTKGMRNDSTVKCGFFRISGNYSAQEILNRLGQWMSRELPNCPSHEQGRPGRRPAHDALNALGAMRLRFCCRTFPEAKVRMKLNEDAAGKSNRLFYGHRKSMDKAIERAVPIFGIFFDSTETEWPLHYSEGWS